MLSILVACYNEEKNIIPTIEEVKKSCDRCQIKPYEILVINDKSSDNSKLIVNNYIDKNSLDNVRLINNEKNLGYGGSIKKAALQATKDFIIWVPGDNAHKEKELIKILKYINEYDVVSTFYTNTETRNKFRQLFTKLYTPILNFFFNLEYPYYNGVTLIRKSIFNKINIYTDSHNFSVEMWVKIKFIKNLKIKFVPTLLDERLKGANAFKLKNSIKVLFNTIRLILYYQIFRFFK